MCENQRKWDGGVVFILGTELLNKSQISTHLSPAHYFLPRLVAAESQCRGTVIKMTGDPMLTESILCTYRKTQ